MLSLRRLGQMAFVAIVALTLLVIANKQSTAAGNTLLDIAYYDGEFSTWVKAVNAAELDNLLTLHSPFTVLAPTDAAFAKLPNSDQLFADSVQLRQLVLYHMVAGYLPAEQLATTTSQRSALGEPFTLRLLGDVLTVNDVAIVTRQDLAASNGVLHGIDTVLLPPALHGYDYVKPQTTEAGSLLALAAADPDCDHFVSEVETVGLEHLLNQKGPFTIFLPVDGVFEAESAKDAGQRHANHDVMKQTMLYHIVLGDFASAEIATQATLQTALGKPLSVTVENGETILNGMARIVSSDKFASNGVIHMIDTMLSVPEGEYATAVHRPVDSTTNTLVDVLATTPSLTTFYDEVAMAGLETLLNKHGDFTVFAPSNAAFAALAPDVMTTCMVNHVWLKQMTLLHIIPGYYSSLDLAAGIELTTALGETVTLRMDNGSILLNESVRLTVTDLPADNGVIHIIDTVLVPQAMPTQ